MERLSRFICLKRVDTGKGEKAYSIKDVYTGRINTISYHRVKRLLEDGECIKNLKLTSDNRIMLQGEVLKAEKFESKKLNLKKRARKDLSFEDYNTWVLQRFKELLSCLQLALGDKADAIIENKGIRFINKNKVISCIDETVYIKFRTITESEINDIANDTIGDNELIHICYSRDFYTYKASDKKFLNSKISLISFPLFMVERQGTDGTMSCTGSMDIVYNVERDRVSLRAHARPGEYYSGMISQLYFDTQKLYNVYWELRNGNITFEQIKEKIS